MVYFIDEMLKASNQELKGKSVVISGSGNVAQYATEKCIHMGAKVLTLSDSSGYIYDNDGINEEKVYKHYVRRFFPAIINGNLIIRYKNKIINTDNIDKILESENMMSPGWVEFYREVFTRQDKEKHFISFLKKTNCTTIRAGGQVAWLLRRKRREMPVTKR